ncbi:hypothetical protein MOO44_00445 (plasmid) [Nicoliella spurrieriana]|uniref:Uncharacterized protein n=1 Tax=Nicoliella spurrieriana TaxID=2925830 RepID=A0A976X540_9LACO|nr:hypothetical protein [Nicoliella spurrieriana]UQS86147.1 hypothetical protein MOO44_00445 [Nicoliella spurrieriana]
MSDLLRKNLENQSRNKMPKNVFSRNELGSDFDNKIKKIEKTRKQREKSTSIRVSVDTANQLNSLVSVLGLDSVTELLGQLSESAVDNLTDDEKIEYKTMKKILDKKRK